MSETLDGDPSLITIIIPAYNEEKNLPVLLDSLGRHLKGININYEVIVIDNNSTDRTVSIVKERGISCISSDANTVSTLRNTGILNTAGDILVFLDADTEITGCWAKRLPFVVEYLNANPRTLTGSPYSISNESNWIEKYWFENLLNNNTYIVGGNLVTTRQMSKSINGFDEGLVSGEDYDFSMRARDNGAQIIIDNELQVIHHGNPRTIKRFMRREIWHGKGDFKSVKTVIKSKIAIASVFFLFLHILALTSLLTGAFLGYFISISLVLALCAIFVFKKFRRTDLKAAAVQLFLSYIYLLSRCLSFLSLLMNRIKK